MSLPVLRSLHHFRHFLPSYAVSRAPIAAYTLPWLSGPGQGRRHIYTPAALGLDQYVKLREDTSARFTAIHDAFKSRMCQVLAEQSGAMIFTEDFKNALHLADSTEEDMDMIRQMARRFHKQHEALRFGMYVFGPVVMRTYHTLKQSREALEALNDPELDGFFDQLSSYQICLDLLYKEGLYEDVQRVFADLQDRRIAGHRYPKNCLNVVVAACYKMGTADSLGTVQTLFGQAQEYGIPLNRRLLVFAAALALKTGQPHTALDLILRSTALTHISVRSIKVVALSQLGRLGEALVALRAIAEIDIPRTPKPGQGKYILREAVEEVEEAVKGSGDKEKQVEFERIKKCLEEMGALSDKSMDELISSPIDRFERRPEQEKAMLQASFNTSQQHQRQHRTSLPYRPPRRRGLTDME